MSDQTNLDVQPAGDLIAPGPNAGLIYKAIIALMREVGPIGKDSHNTSQKFDYRSIDAVYNKIHPLMIKHGVFSAPGKILNVVRESRQTKTGGSMQTTVLSIRYDFYAEDGSSIPCESVGEGMDSGDKATSKAMSMAHKYALFQILCIPITADPDGKSPQHENPDADESAPTAAPRGERVTKEMLAGLWGTWWEMMSHSEDVKVARGEWKVFVCKVCDRDFSTALADWTMEDYRRVAAALEPPQ